MRADGDDGTLLLEVLDGGDGGADASVISDLLAVKGDVDVATDQDLLALEVGVGEVLDGLLGLELEVGGSDGSADAELGCSYIECRCIWQLQIRSVPSNEPPIPFALANSLCCEVCGRTFIWAEREPNK